MKRIKRDTPETNRAFLYLTIVLFLLLTAINIKQANADIGYGQSHEPMEEYAATYRPPLYWPGNVIIQQYGASNDFSPSDLARVIEYGNWSWGQRSGVNMKYTGISPDFRDGATGKIVVKVSPIAEFEKFADIWNTRAVTRYWYDLSSGALVGALIYLNEIYFTKSNYGCTIQTAVHEIGHAIGINGHSSDSHAVMYSSGSIDCRYALSASDALLASANADVCHAELTMGNEIYIPDVLGKRARLIYNGDMTWSLKSLSDNPKTKGCKSVTVSEKMEIEIKDLRGFFASYSNVRLDPIGNDIWKLGWAE